VQKPMPFPSKKLKSKEEEHYNRFCEWMRPLFLQIPLTKAVKMPPYSKYMKDIVTNKRKIPNEEISALLANYSFDVKFRRSLEIQVYQLFLAPLRITMLELFFRKGGSDPSLCINRCIWLFY
jgi:hypothetical protein